MLFNSRLVGSGDDDGRARSPEELRFRLDGRGQRAHGEAAHVRGDRGVQRPFGDDADQADGHAGDNDRLRRLDVQPVDRLRRLEFDEIRSEERKAGGLRPAAKRADC